MVIDGRFDSSQLSESWWYNYCWKVLPPNRNTITKYTKNCNLYIQHWSTEMILSFSYDNARPHVARPSKKWNETDYEILPHSPYSPDLSPTDYFFKYLDKFLREKCFKPQRDAETTFNDFVAFRTPKFYSTGITIITRCALIAMFIILINKILFELRYVHVKNILKITVNKNL